ncbi:hypothetical protein CPB84DRAFT_662235 [Gymnopilus junonius]|uniref:Uncharacterized protein n=1 Tax=Gymnopilus junonius TaxID=109634 RepID=A0A9P5TFV7_GYMJU|nr:hypothetical protein CPB84DRAFT_662235 [Gymnopilus junonius]
MLLCPWMCMMRVAPLSTPSLCSFCHPATEPNYRPAHTMSLKTKFVVALLSPCLLLTPAAQVTTITLFTPIEVQPTPVILAPASLSISTIDVLPGNITEYAIAQAVTALVEAGEGTGVSLSMLVTVTTLFDTIQEEA